METLIKKILAAVLIMLGLLVLYSSLTTAEPTVGEITLDPTTPSPGSTVTFTVSVTADEEIEEVYIVVEECKTGFCYSDGFNKSMTLTNGDYTASLTLKHSDATEMKYYLDIKTSAGWTKTSTEQKTLSANSNSNDNGSNNTPGFEIGIILMAFIMILIVVGRKRLK